MYDQHIIVDFEMNPVSEKDKEVRKNLHEEIIEIGAVKLDEKYNTIDRFSCLIKPRYNTVITPYITRLTKIHTSDVINACDFEKAFRLFAAWIGEKKTRVYSWGDTDLAQLRLECDYKNVEMADNLKRWVDYQPIYQRLMKFDTSKRMALSEAASWYGVYVDKKKIHRALYDAEITAELVHPILTGEYKSQLKWVHREAEKQQNASVTIGEAFSSIFASLRDQLDEG